MSLSSEQKYQLNRLIEHRDSISSSLFQIERILKYYFPDEYDLGYQHYIPQISTALHDQKQWLSRGVYSLQDTIDKLLDMAKEETSTGTGKYI